MKKLVLIVALLSLNSCMLWDVLKPSKGLQVDTEIVAGDKDQTVNSEIAGKKETNNNTAEEIHQVFNTINESNAFIPWIVAMLALMLPTPTRMWIGLKGLFKRRKSNGG